MADNLAELLPVRFEDLTLEHVRDIIERIRDPHETLFFERKQQVTGEAVAKACAAFANTMGGLLLVGVADDDDELVGTNAGGGEPQLWVKDILRGLVIPMPPFRARRLEMEEGRGILLVLVEESAVTPHLLARNGAIYVRNPGSSDPLPLTDQRRLLDLTARGERAEESAATVATELHRLLDARRGAVPKVELITVAATGITSTFEDHLFAHDSPATIESILWGEAAGTREARWSEWKQQRVELYRLLKSPPRVVVSWESHEGALIDRRGGVAAYRGTEEPLQHSGKLNAKELHAWACSTFGACRATLADLGAHGRLRVVYRLEASRRYVDFGGQYERLRPTVVSLWAGFEDDHVRIGDQIIAEVRRAAGLPPVA